MNRFEIHAHTMYSNIRLLDSINKPEDLINRAIKLGLSGICITDHDCISSHVKVNQMAKKLQETHPDFKIGLGNEIYLCDTRDRGQKYYHFILVAKNKEGHRAISELSSDAWLNIIEDRRLERVVTTKDKLREIISKYPGSLVASTACLGGELPTLVSDLIKYEEIEQEELIQETREKINDFLSYCLDLFGKDFYIEVAPGLSKEQVNFNTKVKEFALKYGIKIVVGTDAHYLKKEDRWIHKAYLTSKQGEREVDDFYEYAYLMSDEEVRDNLPMFDYDKLIKNSLEIYNKIEFYDLFKKQIISKEVVYDYAKVEGYEGYPIINKLLKSDNVQERYWINQCLESLKKYNKLNEKYLERVETEADVMDYLGNNLGDCLFAYPNTIQHYIDLFWKCGSIVGPGRGSAVGFLSNYLLGITQIDPVESGLPYWRFLNKSRVELPDIDLDLAPSKRPRIFKEIRKERGELGLLQVATFGTEGTKSAILTACRGYRSEEFPNGIDVDIAQYMSSLIPAERGFLWPLKDVLEGNAEKGRKPINVFIKEVNKYPGLLEIMQGIEGIINKRSCHASGVILFDEEPFGMCGVMRTPGWDLITSYDLHDCEYSGLTKYDFLVTEISDKIIVAIELLQKDGLMEKGELRQIYNKYLHPSIIDVNDSKIWDALGEGNVLDVFQFSTGVGLTAAKKIKPRSVYEMTDANSLMRLMAEKGQELPLDRYCRLKRDMSQWYAEMDRYGLSKEEQKNLEQYYLASYGTPPQQEDLMLILMDSKICGFSLKDANSARKTVAKKKMNEIPALRKHIFSSCENKNLAQYVWDTAINPQLG